MGILSPSLLLKNGEIPLIGDLIQADETRIFKPLAVGLSLGIVSLTQTTCAHAGEWEIVPLPVAPKLPTNSTEYQKWMDEEFIPRFPGQFHLKSYGFPQGGGGSIDNKPVLIKDALESLITLPRRHSKPIQAVGHAWIYSTGGQGLVQFHDKPLNVILRWKPRNLPSASYYSQPDPDDKPDFSKPAYLKMEVSARAVAKDEANNTLDQTHAKEHVSLSISAGEDRDYASQVLSDPAIAGRSVDQSKTLYIKLQPESSPSAPLTLFSLDATAELDGERSSRIFRSGGTTGESSLGWNLGNASVYFTLSGDLTPYNVEISGDLESPATYHKITDPAYLPMWIDLNTGKTEANTTQFRDGIYNKTGPWSVKVTRPVNGEMQVDTTYLQVYKAVEPTPDNFLTPFADREIELYGRGTFTAQAHGFTTPSFEWSLQGGSPQNSVVDELQANSSQVDLSASTSQTGFLPPDTEISGVYLGTAEGAAVKSSTLKVKVTETAPSLPFVTLSNSYVVNWHLPDENWQHLPGDVTLPDDVRTFGPEAKNGNPFVYLPPSKEVGYNYRSGLKTGTAVYDVLLSAFRLAKPEAKFAAGVATLVKSATNAGVVFSETPPEPPQLAHIDTSYNDFKDDLLALAGDERKDAECTPEIAGMSAEVFNRLVQTLRNGGTAATDGDWKSGNLQIQAEAHYPQHSEAWQTDTFDEKGYVGLGNHSAVVHGGRSIKRKWVWIEQAPPQGVLAPQDGAYSLPRRRA